MAEQIAGTKGDLFESFTGRPSVSIRGRMAQVWGEYEFQRDGKFLHCGVDSVSVLKTADGWKVATIVYTAETTSCEPFLRRLALKAGAFHRLAAGGVERLLHLLSHGGESEAEIHRALKLAVG